MPVRLYTIGHSTHGFEGFVALLHVHGIRRLVDVRTVPRSRRIPWASSATLPGALAPEGIDYLHMAELGGLRRPRPDSPNAGWRNSGFRGYADHMQTPEFDAAMGRLLELAADAPTTVMCAEAVPWRCHRGLIADAALARGADVRHILSAAPPAAHAMTSFARVEGRRVTYPGDPGQARLPE